MKKIFLLVFIASLSISCAQKQEEQKPSLLSDFWKKEIARLNKEKPMITKISTVNGKTDTIRTDSVDWEKELQMFVKNDLFEKDLAMYAVDSFVVYDTLVIADDDGNMIYKSIPAKGVVFTAKDGDQKIRKMTLWNGNPYFRIDLIIKDDQQLYGLSKRMTYHVGRYYQIEGSQDVKFLDGINYKVQVLFH